MKVKETPKDTLINSIIETEWFLFDKVQNVSGRCGCQDDEWTFYVNRYSQFNAWGMDTLRSYAADLETALKEGRNPITEKYAYMMETTDPEYYHDSLEPYLPAISERKAKLVEAITTVMVSLEHQFELKYPNFSRGSRPLAVSAAGDVSTALYSTGELKTYSENTLAFLAQDLEKAIKEGRSIPKEIHERVVKFYGYQNMEDAESKLGA